VLYADLDKDVPIEGTLKAVHELETKLGIDLLEPVKRPKLWKNLQGTAVSISEWSLLDDYRTCIVGVE